MREIETQYNKNILVDEIDYSRVLAFRWTRGGHIGHRILQTSIGGKSISIGRFILSYDGPLEVDHINCNIWDNRRSNLRLATKSQQQANSKPTLGRKYKGFYKNQNGKYRATIWLNGKRIHIGYFQTEIEAAKAYNRAATEYFGEYARLNKVDE